MSDRIRTRTLSALLVLLPLASLALVVVVQRSQRLLGPWYVEMLLAVAVIVCCSVAAGLPGFLAGGGAVVVLLAVASSAAVPADLLQRTPFALIASVSEVLLVGVGAAAGLRMLDRATREADARAQESMTVTSERQARERATRDQRELQRTLHDTALNTLEAVAHHGDRLDPSAVGLRCRADAQVLAAWLDGAGSSTPVSWAAALEDELARARALGLSLSVGPGLADVGEMLPSDVVVAMTGALREALLNVAKHAGVTSASVIGVAEDGSVEIRVQDAGRGFVPEAADDARGLAQSVRGRMEQAGGSAEILSDAVSGTTVLLRWTAPDRPSEDGSRAWQDRLATIVLAVSLALMLVDGLFLLVAREAWTRPVVALASWVLPLVWLLWLWRAHAGGRRLSLSDIVATLGVFAASSLLATLSDPFCVAPLGELSGADGRLLLLAALVVLLPTREVLTAAVLCVLVVSLFAGIAWHAAWPLCGTGSLAQAVLGVLLLVAVRALGAAIARAARATEEAVRVATAARIEIRRQMLLSSELVSWTSGILAPVAEALEEVARSADSGAPASSDVRLTCSRLAQALRALLGVGAGSEPLQRFLRAWMMSNLDSSVSLAVRGRIDELQTPEAVVADVIACLDHVHGSADVIVLGWQDRDHEGLIVTVRPTPVQAAAATVGAVVEPPVAIATLMQSGDGSSEAASLDGDWEWDRTGPVT